MDRNRKKRFRTYCTQNRDMEFLFTRFSFSSSVRDQRNQLFRSQRNISTSPMLSRSSYTSLSNRLVLTNFLRQPPIWHSIQMSKPSLFVFCNTILDIKNIQKSRNVFIVESIASCSAFNLSLIHI